MKIKDGLKLGGRIVEIPDCGRDDMAKFFVERGFKVGVEVGVDKGEFTRVLCDAGLKVFAIDCWKNYRGYKREGKYASNFPKAVKDLEGYDCELIRKYSMDAVDDFKDYSLDFVYLDANHSLPYITQDIMNWHRKLKKGGIMSGHDYATIIGHLEKEDNVQIFDGCHVRAAVDACVDVMKIKKCYILGKRFSKTRDKWRTWMWFKQ